MYADQDKFYFQCNVMYPACDADDHSRFEVTFWATSQIRESQIHSEVTTCLMTSIVMDESHLKGNLGKNVSNIQIFSYNRFINDNTKDLLKSKYHVVTCSPENCTSF